MGKLKKNSNRNGTGRTIAGIILLIIGCIMIFCVSVLIVEEGVSDWFFNALCCLFGLPGASLLLAGVRVLRGRRKNSWVILIGIVLGIIGFGILVSHYHPDISDINTSISVTLDLSGDTAFSEEMIEDNTLHWYTSAEKAMQDDSLVRSSETYVSYDKLTDAVGLEESNGSVTAFYGIRGDDEHLAIYYYKTKNGKYSQPYQIDKPMCFNDSSYHYDLDDAVSESIVDQYASGAVFDRNKDVPFFWGCWKNKEELKSLTIEGQPVETIRRLSDSSPYYFWMIRSDKIVPDLQTIDFNGFTYQQVTDALNIRYHNQDESGK